MPQSNIGLNFSATKIRKREFIEQMHFWYTKVRYRGLRKNTKKLYTPFALENFCMARARLLINSQSRPVMTA